MSVTVAQGIGRLIKPSISNVSTLVMNTNPNIVSIIKSTLLSHGIKNVATCDSVQTLEEQLPELIPDLIIVELSAPADEVFDIAKSIRLGGHGCNPYAVLVALTEDTRSEFIGKTLSAGFDDVIAAPISIKLLVERLIYLTKNRKPFVMAPSYVGPDRRTSRDVSGKRTQSYPLFKSPNPLNSDSINLEEIYTFKAAVEDIKPQHTIQIRESMYKEIRGKANEIIEELTESSDSDKGRPLAPELREILLAYCEIIDSGVADDLPKIDERLLDVIIEIGEKHKKAWVNNFDILQHLMEMVNRAHKF